MTSTFGPIEVEPDVMLVPRSVADAADVFGLVEAHREDLRTWLPWVDVTRRFEDAQRYALFAEHQFERRMGFDYAIRRDGLLAGTIGLHDVDWIARAAKIGYWLAPGARGHGIMTRSAAALTRHAFDEFGFHRLEIRAVVENAASRAIPERLGYHREGILKDGQLLHGEYRDLVLYAMTATQWRGRVG